ncbi:hypothetical protein PTKIN_Ptkin14bG0071500 [Pterospermum kingtungense]
MNDNVVMFLVFICLFCLLTTSTSNSTLTPGHSVKDNNSDTLISADGSFQLGFFSPGNFTNRYLGIWYNTKKIPIRTVVWVANRETPISNSSGVLRISSQGILQLSSSTNSIFWSSNSSRPPQNPVAELLDSGNLVVRDRAENILWQSFDHPSDTLLPGMKLGKNFIAGKETFLSSWKSADDPAQGEFSCRIDTRGFPQVVVMKGHKIYHRPGSWNGLTFTGTPGLKKNNIYSFEFISNEKEVYYTYKIQSSSVVSRLVLSQSGPPKRFVWIDRTHTWFVLLTMRDNCDDYALCGANGKCNILDTPICECLEGFVPKFPRDWSIFDWTGGCVRRTEPNCGIQDGFLQQSRVKLPDTSFSWFNTTMSLEMCREMCLKNCSCTAYANSDIRGGGTGCLLWFRDLMDITEYSEDGQDLYIRIAASELDNIEKQRHTNPKKVRIIVSLAICFIGSLIIIGSVLLFIWKKKHQILVSTKAEDRVDEDDSVKLPRYDFNTIEMATDNFSSNNKLGQGGFGPVYKGTLRDGQEIAVKRLSGKSGQGQKEFENEVIFIARLQHRNLVKLLGCCIQGDERLLIYEYLPNGSLDYFIFDRTRMETLDWRIRFHIIYGIARGLLYLHQDSRLRIIHRDLKASNVLLDKDMNPKISDFGLAKTFGGDQSVANTKRVAGTYGYMPPEYAIDGFFSVKSDVFSFGVLLLEILSGKRNRGFHHSDHHLNLLGHAWSLWMDEKPLELIDEFLLNCCVVSEVLRCIHVALLCVQKLPKDRPNMAAVVVMFSSDGSLPQPKQPGFYTERDPLEIESLPNSINEITSTFIEAR